VTQSAATEKRQKEQKTPIKTVSFSPHVSDSLSPILIAVIFYLKTARAKLPGKPAAYIAGSS
jgi:hypothetical protein